VTEIDNACRSTAQVHLQPPYYSLSVGEPMAFNFFKERCVDISVSQTACLSFTKMLETKPKDIETKIHNKTH
jgi:hypothetical protein